MKLSVFAFSVLMSFLSLPSADAATYVAQDVEITGVISSLSFPLDSTACSSGALALDNVSIEGVAQTQASVLLYKNCQSNQALYAGSWGPLFQEADFRSQDLVAGQKVRISGVKLTYTDTITVRSGFFSRRTRTYVTTSIYLSAKMINVDLGVKVELNKPFSLSAR